MHIVLATHNQGKVNEFRSALAPFNVEITSAGEIGLPEPEETGDTFSENALLKARHAYHNSGKPSLADDSGLAVNVLNGDPGIYSARWAGPDKDFNKAMRRVRDELSSHNDTSAAFICVLAFIDPDGKEHIFKGQVEGRIVWPPRGEKGFGYDPIFEPHETPGKTFAELPADKKRALSHRGLALNAFVADILAG